MQFLKTLFWVVVAVAAVVFAMRNWTVVTVNLWGGMLVDAKLPVLLFGAFAVGFLPTFALHRATRWQLRRRLDSHERVIANIRGVGEPAIAAETPATSPAPLPGSPPEPMVP
ncbi:MAG TPA: LapA family protein [Sphingomonas sp.]